MLAGVDVGEDSLLLVDGDDVEELLVDGQGLALAIDVIRAHGHGVGDSPVVDGGLDEEGVGGGAGDGRADRGEVVAQAVALGRAAGMTALEPAIRGILGA